MSDSKSDSPHSSNSVDCYANVQLEYAILSSCIKSEGCIDLGIDGQLQATDFSLDYNGKIWRALVALYNEKRPIDEVVLVEYLSNKTSFSEKALILLIGQILEVVDVANAAKFITYLDALKERSKRRKLGNTLSVLTKSLNDKMKTADELISGAEQAIMELQMGSGENDCLHPTCDLIHDILAEIAAERSTEPIGVLTGINGLDECLHGLKNGQVFVIAARPSIGKTALALNIAVNVARADKSVLFISLEMGANELMNRLLALLSGVNLRAYRDGYCAHGTEDKLQAVGSKLSKLPIIIDDYCMQKASTITSTVRRMQRKYGTKLVIIDYLQLIAPRNSNIPREQQIAEISRALKFMAKSLDIPVICLAQLNRSAEIENRTPRLSDLRESGTIEQDADIAAFLDRSEDTRKYDEAGLNFVERDLLVAKNRSGMTTRVRLVFNRGAMRFDMRTDGPAPVNEAESKQKEEQFSFA